MHKKILLLLLFVICNFYFLHSQVSPFNNNIILEEDNSGTLIFDALHANNRLFVYSANNLLIYDDNGTQLLQTIKLTNLTKFAPNFFSYSTWVPSASTMVYNYTDNILYLVRADLKVEAFGFNIDNNVESLGIKISTPNEITDQKTLHGYSIIKYDNVHNRLFWVVQGRSKGGNNTGSFHVRETYFGIYNVENSGQTLNQIHEEYYDHDFVQQYCDAIYDVEYTTENDNYYLARIYRVDVFNIVENNNQTTIEEVGSLETDEGKIGKLLYIDDKDKMLAFPYRLPFVDGNTEPDSSDYDIHFYSIDINTYDVDSIDSPDRRIIDAVYLPSSHDLILCRNPVNDIYNNTVNEQDVAIYNWDGDNIVPISEDYLINTNAFPNNTEANTPIRMVKVGNNGVILSKKHEIVHLYKPLGGDNYLSTQKHVGINNFFFSSTKSNNNAFVINLVNNGIVKLNPINYDTTTRTSFMPFHIVKNEQGGKLYFFNKLNSYNPGLYIYDTESEQTVNINDLNPEGERINNPIGDIVYNSLTNQLLVSENAPNGINNGVKCFNGTTGIYEESITIPSGYCKKMFIAPNGLLYIAADMKHENNSQPNIYIIDIKNDYQIVNGTFGTGVNIPIPFTNFSYYSANFCYNPYNQSVYATFKPQKAAKNPYISSPENSDTIIIEDNSTLDPNGVLLKLTNVVLNQDASFINPGEVICREPLVGSNDNTNGYLFVQELNNITVYNCDDGTKENATKTFTNITYSSYYDKLYGLSNYHDSILGTGSRVYEIDYDNPQGSQDLIYSTLGIVAACTYNPYDNMLYLYHRLDNEMLGDLTTNVIKLDPSGQNNPQIIDLGDDDGNDKFNFFYPEILQKSQTPIINPYNNKLYFPNGGHSSVSIIDFEPNETLLLNNIKKISWLSFPRLNRNLNAPIEVNLVLEDNITPNTSPYNYLVYSEIEHLNNSDGWPYKSVFNSTDWVGYPPFELDEIQSTLGYKLTLEYDDIYQPENVWLNMQGTVLDANYKTDLNNDYENWTGYWLYQEQDIFDALADFKDDLYLIKHQNWCCVRMEPTEGGVPFEPLLPFVCDEITRNIKYGDMVVLKSFFDHNAENGNQFYWNHSGNQPRRDIYDEVEYYSYTETPDYTPFVIELDSTQNPVEMGAFINDSCIGACTLTPTDTLVIIKGYIGNQPGDSVVFEEYFATKLSNNKRITDYYVYNPEKQLKEKRTIRTGENRDAYFISFTAPEKQLPQNTNALFTVYPNPTNSKINIKYTVGTTAKVAVNIYDNYGRLVATIHNNVQHKGLYKLEWDLIGSNGKKLQTGLYIIKLKVDDYVISKKLVVN